MFDLVQAVGRSAAYGTVLALCLRYLIRMTIIVWSMAGDERDRRHARKLLRILSFRVTRRDDETA